MSNLDMTSPGTTCANAQVLNTREANLQEYLERYFALSRRQAAIKDKKLYSLEVELTQRCNLECAYCYSSSCNNLTNELSLERLKDLLSGAYDYGIRSVSWFGGEPLLHPNLFEILEFTKKLCYHESIIYTNGSLINLDIAKRLRLYVDTVAVHLDTLSPAVFGQIHPVKPVDVVKNLHSRILDSFKYLLEAGFGSDDIRLTLTLCKPVYDGLEELFDWAFNVMGLQTSIFIPLAPFGRAKDLPRDWYPSDDEVKRAYELRAEYEKRPYLLELGVSEYCKQYQMSMCYIQANGFVTPYAGSREVCGNIFDSPISKIIANKSDQLMYRKYSDGFQNSALAGVCFNCQNHRYCFGNAVLSKLYNHNPNHYCFG